MFVSRRGSFQESLVHVTFSFLLDLWNVRAVLTLCVPGMEPLEPFTNLPSAIGRFPCRVGSGRKACASELSEEAWPLQLLLFGVRGWLFRGDRGFHVWRFNY